MSLGVREKVTEVFQQNQGLALPSFVLWLELISVLPVLDDCHHSHVENHDQRDLSER